MVFFFPFGHCDLPFIVCGIRLEDIPCFVFRICGVRLENIPNFIIEYYKCNQLLKQMKNPLAAPGQS